MAEEERSSVFSEKDQFRFLKRLPWEKITIWAIFIVLLYLLRSFFTIIFLTFILSYVSWNLVNYTVRRLKINDPQGYWRRGFTVVVFIIYIAVILGAGRLVVPKVIEQGKLLLEQIRVLIPSPRDSNLPVEKRADEILLNLLGQEKVEALRAADEYGTHRRELISLLGRLRDGCSPVAETEDSREQKPRFGEPGEEAPGGEGKASAPAPGEEPSSEDPDKPGGEASPGSGDEAKNGEEAESAPDAERKLTGKEDLRFHVEAFLEKVMGTKQFEKFKASPEYQTTYADLARSLQGLITENIPGFVDFMGLALRKVMNYVLDFLLSLIFSFLLVFSLPVISRNVVTLEKSKLGGFYREIAPSLIAFSRSMGRAFQGQAVIALCNTALTLVGLKLLGIPNAVVLSVIVFICSFIPVLGVFISSVPICLLAIQTEGILLAIEAVVLITFIHLIEAYFLNPRIMGSVMHMHPLLVLVLLFAFEHFFGVWGLLLAVPAFHYLFYQVILGRKPGWEKDQPEDPPPDESEPPAPRENIGNEPMSPASPREGGAQPGGEPAGP